MLLPAFHVDAGPRIVAIEAPADARQPQIAVGKAAFLVVGTPGAVLVSTSSDGGASFGPAAKIGDVGALALGLRRGPRVAVAGDAVVVTAIAGARGQGLDEDILSWHSTDAGATWIFDGRVNETPSAAREGLHALASGPNGGLFCAWIDLAQGTPRICGASSSASTLGRWSSTHVVFGDAERICPCCHPSVAFDAKGRVYVTWRGVERGARDMVVAWSDDGGGTFSQPRKLGEGTWTIDACPMDGGSISTGGGTLRTVWRRESTVFRSTLTGPEKALGEGEQAVLAWAGGGEYVAWLERRGGTLLLLRPRAELPTRLDETANDPVIAVGPPRTGHTRQSGVPPGPTVFMAWESGPPRSPRIVVARIDERR